MEAIINVKQLRALLPKLIVQIRKGARFTVLYRSHPAFKIIPINEIGSAACDLKDDPLYQARALGRSKDGKSSIDHDSILYGS